MCLIVLVVMILFPLLMPRPQRLKMPMTIIDDATDTGTTEADTIDANTTDANTIDANTI